MNETQQKILHAARELIAEGAPSGPTVRAVAARAGVGASTLRYYYPTQQALFEAISEAAFDSHAIREHMRDNAIPARQRLADCLSRHLPPVPAGPPARQFWTMAINGLTAAEKEMTSRKYAESMTAQAREEVAAWLELLDGEGALRESPTRHHVHFLWAVVDGLLIGRIAAEGHLSEEEERAVIEQAVAAVLK